MTNDKLQRWLEMAARAKGAPAPEIAEVPTKIVPLGVGKGKLPKGLPEPLYMDYGTPFYFDEKGTGGWYRVYWSPRWAGDAQPYQVSRMGYGREASFATVEEAIADAKVRIVGKVTPPAPKVAKPPLGVAKKPWQMTREEMLAIAERDFPTQKAKQARYFARARQWHINQVQRALSEGKPVPQEVLADYPELAKAVEHLLAKTEGNPLRKFCCRQCGECAPAELLEEGRFPDRIAWLRKHYFSAHPGMWAKHFPRGAF